MNSNIGFATVFGHELRGLKVGTHFGRTEPESVGFVFVWMLRNFKGRSPLETNL